MTATAPRRETTEQLVEFHLLHVDSLTVAGDNVRANVGDVTQLASSIKAQGMVQPIVATMRNDEDGARFVVVAGHRRLAAAKKAGLEKVPVILRTMDEQQRVEAMLVENLEREDLTPLEEAAGYQRLLDEFGLSQRQLAERVSRSQGHVSKRLSLLSLPEAVRGQIDSGGIAVSDAVELTKLSGDEAGITRALAGVTAWSTLADSVEQVLDEKTRQDVIDARVLELQGKGKPAVAQTVHGYQTKLPSGAFKIAKAASFGAVLLIDPRTHAKLDCHAIAVGAKPSDDVVVCTKRRNHPDVKTADQKRQESGSHSNSSYEKQRARQEELEVVAAARMKFVAELLDRKTAFTKAEALDLILRHTIDSFQAYGSAGQAFTDLVGIASKDVDEKKLDEWAAKSGELMRVALISTLLDIENSSCSSWAGANAKWGADDIAWLTFLEQRGYELTEAERAAMPKVKGKKAA